MVKCPDCGKELKNTQALSGHMRLAHGKRVLTKAGVLSKPRPPWLKCQQDIIRRIEALPTNEREPFLRVFTDERGAVTGVGVMYPENPDQEELPGFTAGETQE